MNSLKSDSIAEWNLTLNKENIQFLVKICLILAIDDDTGLFNKLIKLILNKNLTKSGLTVWMIDI